MQTSRPTFFIKDFFQGYEPLEYALEPDESPIFKDYQDKHFSKMLKLLKQNYKVRDTSMTKGNIFIFSFCLSFLVLLLINHKFSILSKYDRNENKRVPNINIIIILALVISLIVYNLN